MHQDPPAHGLTQRMPSARKTRALTSSSTNANTTAVANRLIITDSGSGAIRMPAYASVGTISRSASELASTIVLGLDDQIQSAAIPVLLPLIPLVIERLRKHRDKTAKPTDAAA
jgi:hypothetical protein